MGNTLEPLYWGVVTDTLSLVEEFLNRSTERSFSLHVPDAVGCERLT